MGERFKPNPDQPKKTRRSFLGFLGAAGLIGAGEVVRRKIIKNDSVEQPTAQTNKNLETENKPELSLEEETKKLKTTQEAFKLKFGFPAELTLPESLKQAEANSDDEQNLYIKNEWLSFIKQANSLLEAVISNELLNPSEILPGLRDIGVKKWKIPVEQTSANNNVTNILNTLSKAVNEAILGFHFLNLFF